MKKYVGTPGVKRYKAGNPDDLVLTSALVIEPSVYDEQRFNPGFSIYRKVATGLIGDQQTTITGQALHDHLWDYWMADKSCTEALESIVI